VGTENFDHIKPVVESGGGNVKLVGRAWGSVVTGTNLVGSGDGDNIKPAGLFSTAPYVEPKKPKSRLGMCRGKNDTCENTKKLRYNGLCAGCDLARMRTEVS
jgi:Fe-S cluster biogenesis protein NfuA